MSEKRLVVTIEGKDALSPTTKAAAKYITDLGKKANKLDDISAKFNKIANSSAPMKRQLRDIQKLMGEMNLDGLGDTAIFSEMAQRAGELRDAMSDANQAINAFANDNMKLQAAAQGLSLVASGASIATGAMGLLGVENEKVEQMILKVQSAMSILNGVQAIANVLNKDSALMLRLKAIAIKQSTASTTADTVATTANTVAEGANTAATTANNVVRKAWNMTVAIGKALLGDWTGLVLVGAAALVTYAMCTEDSTKKNEENAESINRVKEAQSNYTSSLTSSVAQIQGKMRVLETQYKSLRTEGEKVQWIKDNKNEFNKLGLSINGVSDAESVFVNNTPKIIAALTARAKAIAAQERIIDDYKQMYADLDDVDKRNSVDNGIITFDMPVSVGENISVKTARNLGIWDGSYAWQKVTQEQYDKLKKTYSNKAQTNWRNDRANTTDKWNTIIQRHTAEMVEAQKAAEEAAKGFEKVTTPTVTDTSGKGNPTAPKKEETPLDPKSLAFAEKKVSELQDQLKKIDPTDNDAAAKLQGELKNWQRIVNDRKIALGIEPTIEEGSYNWFDQQIKELQDRRKLLLSTECDPAAIKGIDDEIKALSERKRKEGIRIGLEPAEGSIADLENKVQAALDNYKELLDKDVPPAVIQAALQGVEDANKRLQAKKIEIGVEAVPTIRQAEVNTHFAKGSIEDKRQSYDNARSQIDQIKDDFDRGIINYDAASRQINALNEQLQALGLKPIEVEFRTNMDVLNEQFDVFSSKVGGVLNGFSALDGIVGSVQSLTQSIEDGANAWEVFSGVLGIATSVMTTAQAVMEIINLFHAKSAALQTAEAAATTASTTALTAKSAANGVEAGTAAANVAANKALEASYLDLAAAAYFAAHAYIPFAGFGIASGFVTSMLATMAGVKAATLALSAFADGGIVQGTAFHGDTTLVRANKGEMILNKAQQANLFNALKSGGVMGGNGVGKVEFAISGSTLKGVLNNYDAKQKKIR